MLQSDQQDLLITVLKATARALGGNMQERQKPADSSQSQGSAERYHATLAAQIEQDIQSHHGLSDTVCLPFLGLR